MDIKKLFRTRTKVVRHLRVTTSEYGVKVHPYYHAIFRKWWWVRWKAVRTIGEDKFYGNMVEFCTEDAAEKALDDLLKLKII